jgi:hypothetical protein
MASDLQKFGLRLEKHTVRTHTHDLQIGHPDTQQLHSCQPANLVARRPPRPRRPAAGGAELLMLAPGRRGAAERCWTPEVMLGRGTVT